MKDQVDCREEGEIAVKGIAYPITTFRVIDLIRDGASVETAIQAQLPHLSLNMEPRRMSPDERSAAAAVLQGALAKLSSSDPHAVPAEGAGEAAPKATVASLDGPPGCSPARTAASRLR